MGRTCFEQQMELQNEWHNYRSQATLAATMFLTMIQVGRGETHVWAAALIKRQ